MARKLKIFEKFAVQHKAFMEVLRTVCALAILAKVYFGG